ncbi:hypothetical protein V1478_017436 [Vespula squamosa]|uniref:Uncharacterized protein n=1 Tax=Vespula squamosa TaxID=30214 RepID=A0ABD1ZWV7_VESSQ
MVFYSKFSKAAHRCLENSSDRRNVELTIVISQRFLKIPHYLFHNERTRLEIKNRKKRKKLTLKNPKFLKKITRIDETILLNSKNVKKNERKKIKKKINNNGTGVWLLSGKMDVECMIFINIPYINRYRVKSFMRNKIKIKINIYGLPMLFLRVRSAILLMYLLQKFLNKKIKKTGKGDRARAGREDLPHTFMYTYT